MEAKVPVKDGWLHIKVVDGEVIVNLQKNVPVLE